MTPLQAEISVEADVWTTVVPLHILNKHVEFYEFCEIFIISIIE